MYYAEAVNAIAKMGFERVEDPSQGAGTASLPGSKGRALGYASF